MSGVCLRRLGLSLEEINFICGLPINDSGVAIPDCFEPTDSLVIAISAQQKYNLQVARERLSPIAPTVRFVSEPIAATAGWLGHTDQHSFAGILLICDLSKTSTVSLCRVDACRHIHTLYSQEYPDASSDKFDLQCVRTAFYNKTGDRQWSIRTKNKLLVQFADRREKSIEQINQGLTGYVAYPNLLSNKTALAFEDGYTLSCQELLDEFSSTDLAIKQALSTALDWARRERLTVDAACLTGEFSRFLPCQNIFQGWTDCDVDVLPDAIEQGAELIATGEINPHPKYPNTIGIQLSTINADFEQEQVDIPLILAGEWTHALKEPIYFTAPIATANHTLTAYLWIQDGQSSRQTILPPQTISDSSIPSLCRVGLQVEGDRVSLVVEDSETQLQQTFEVKAPTLCIA